MKSNDPTQVGNGRKGASRWGRVWELIEPLHSKPGYYQHETCLLEDFNLMYCGEIQKHHIEMLLTLQKSFQRLCRTTLNLDMQALSARVHSHDSGKVLHGDDPYRLRNAEIHFVHFLNVLN